MAFAGWILELFILLAATLVIALAVVYLVAVGVSRLVTGYGRRRKLAGHG